MLPTFVIGLREGLEAALIVGIIAAFLRKQGRRELMRWVFVGVGCAVLLCVAAGVALDAYSRDLPQRQQEGLETVIGVLAVGMVTYMVVWMKRHSRELKGQLEGMAAGAMRDRGRGARAMVAMAFLAVLREGLESVVFLLAVFDASGSSSPSAATGAVLGIAAAIGLGYGIYRGGVRINLSKFFRATGLVLVLVAAGLVVTALHTAHEAGWLSAGQSTTVDLSWLVDPGSVQSSLLTGMLGVQPRPVLIELIGWLVYLIPVGVYVVWPPGRGFSRRTTSRLLLAAGVVLSAGAATFALVTPAGPATNPVTGSGPSAVRVVSADGDRVVVHAPAGSAADAQDVTLHRTGTAERSGIRTDVYTATRPGAGTDARPARLRYAQIAAHNGGHLPIGLDTSGATTASVRYSARDRVTAWLDPGTDRVVDLRRQETVTAAVVTAGGTALPLDEPIAVRTDGLPPATVTAAVSAARRDATDAEHRAVLQTLAWTVGALAALALGVGAAMRMPPRRRAEEPVGAALPATPVS